MRFEGRPTESEVLLICVARCKSVDFRLILVVFQRLLP